MSNPKQDFFTDPSREIGGAVIPIIGPPGSGKTNALIQMALKRKKEGHKVLWRGIEEGEWLKFLANDEKVTVWNHEQFERVRVKKADRRETTFFELEEVDGVEVKQWDKGVEVIKNSRQDSINVVNVPGVVSDNFEEEVWFTEKFIEIFEAIYDRNNTYKWVDFFTDEAGDIFPNQQQAKGRLNNLVARKAPKLLAQMRKKNSLIYMAVHGVQDFHHMIYKVKSNTIGYMRFSNVVKQIHPSVDRSKVNKLDRGEMIIPPWHRAEFSLAYEEQDLDWVGENAQAELDWNHSLDLEDENDEDNIDGRKRNNITKSEAARKLWKEMDDLSQNEAGKIFEVDQTAVAKASVNE